MVKTAMFVMIFIIFMGISSASAAKASFPDIAGHWAEEYIGTLAEKGIVSGMGDGLFHPDDLVTTAQFVAMILQSKTGAAPATDGHWDSGYLEEANRLELIDSYDAGEWSHPIMRRSAARIGLESLHKLFHEADEPDIKAAEDRLVDLYLCNACVWSTGQFYVKGIMVGRSDSMFHGDDYLTRAEAAVVVMKMLDPSLRTPKGPELPKTMENGLISADEAIKLIKTNRNAVLVDVRSQEDHNAGFIEGSICVPLPDIIADISQTALPPDKSAIIIFYCQKGSRSQKAVEILKEAGYENVYSVGGIDDWPYDIYSIN